ncbi:hypothetical protein PCANC_26183 [Puccinia coronata f. sp. avenae]|uniref:Uncharacterized protein n=1 Tax=Puccinia coronata f. sp. avenae TaxID=200324 RepID=A0A2N5TJW3_9BASI|nr:hypothetical protein PCANC_26622 [Puccinia coronata f. sp. avenae]PLW25771.1 hypothetical protein PCANC_26183 [Puccinia coronata f. sp. avenae]
MGPVGRILPAPSSKVRLAQDPSLKRRALTSCASSQQGAATHSILQHIRSIRPLRLDMFYHASTYCHNKRRADA